MLTGTPLKVHAYVFGCIKRPGLVLPYLADQSHTLHIGTDYSAEGYAWKPIYSHLNIVSHTRVFRGHQDMARRFLQTKDEVALFFEDDACPNTPDWPKIVNAAVEQFTAGSLKGLEVFYLHGRNFRRERFKAIEMIEGREVLQLRSDVPQCETKFGGRHHVYGSMAYLLNRASAEKWINMPWEGIPIDTIQPDRFNFAVLHPSPFDHDRSQGSIVDPKRQGVNWVDLKPQYRPASQVSARIGTKHPEPVVRLVPRPRSAHKFRR